MKDKIQIVVIKKPDGSIWNTPKGKSSWSSVGAAKNAWGCHTWKNREPPLHRSRTQCKWSEDAEASGWKVEVLKEYKLAEIT